MDDTPFTVEVRCTMPDFSPVHFRCGVWSEAAGMAVLNALMHSANHGLFILWQRDAGQVFYAAV